MAERMSMNASLTAELSAFVKALVNTGRFQSDSEVVRQGLRLQQEHELGISQLKSKISKGIRQADRGNLIDGQDILDQLAKRSRSRKRKAR